MPLLDLSRNNIWTLSHLSASGGSTWRFCTLQTYSSNTGYYRKICAFKIIQLYAKLPSKLIPRQVYFLAKVLAMLVVMAPDRYTGEFFAATLRQELLGVEVRLVPVVVEPRVLGQERNPSPLIATQLAHGLVSVAQLGATLCVCACNTLCLWLDEAKEKAQSICPTLPKIVCTLDAVQDCLPTSGTLWLGTSVLMRELTARGCETALKYDSSVLALTQEVIWRTKAVYGMACETASEYVGLESEEFLRQRVAQLLRKVESFDSVERVVLGCTELPLVIDQQMTAVSLVDPAVCVAARLKDCHHEVGI